MEKDFAFPQYAVRGLGQPSDTQQPPPGGHIAAAPPSKKPQKPATPPAHQPATPPAVHKVPESSAPELSSHGFWYAKSKNPPSGSPQHGGTGVWIQPEGHTGYWVWYPKENQATNIAAPGHLAMTSNIKPKPIGGKDWKKLFSGPDYWVLEGETYPLTK